MTMNSRLKYISLIAIILLMIVACKRKTGTVPANSKDTIVLFVGGLGHSQLDDVYDHFGKYDVTRITFTKQDDYREDLDAFIGKLKYKKLIIVCHSWGGASASTVKATIDLLILYDPVGFNQGNIHLGTNVRKTLWFPRIDARGVWPVSADVTGYDIQRADMLGGHNSGTHSGNYALVDTSFEALP